jgi:ligand-binding sensor domain-containing protein/two-component sensor histidine kinase
MKKLLFILLMAPFVMAEGQEKEFVFTKITKQFGLASPKVNAIFKDHHGFYWIGTNKGLQRYDSRNMINFKHDPADSTSLPDNNVIGLFTDRQHRLWVNSGGIPCLYDPIHQRFKRISFDYDKHYLVITSIYQDSKGLVWMYTRYEGQFVYDSVNNIFKKYTFVLPPFDGNVYKILEDTVNNYYWLSTSKGLAIYDVRKKTYHTAGSNPLNRACFRFPALAVGGPDIYKGNNNVLWFQLWEPPAGFTHYRYDISKDELTSLHLGNGRLFGWLTDASGTAWAYGSVLAYYDNKTKAVKHINRKKNSQYGIDFNDVNQMSEDNEGNLWAVTNLGLYYFNPRHQYFSTVIPSFVGVTDKWVEANTNGFVETADGHLILLSWGGKGLYFFDTAFNQVEPLYGFDAKKVKDPNHLLTWCGLQDNKGLIWIGAQHGRIIQLDPTTRKTTFLHPPEFDDLTIRSMTEDRNGNIWFGTQKSIIVKWSRSENKFRKIGGFDKEINPLGWVLRILRGNDNDLWASTIQGGLVHIDCNTDTVKRILPDKKNPHAISSTIIRDMIRLNDHTLALATSRSFDLLDLHTKTFTHIPEEIGVNADGIISMTMDQNGNIWCSSVDGIFRLNLYDKSVKEFGIAEGITEQDFQPNAVINLRHSKIVFGNTRGFVSFSPADIRDGSTPDDVKITGFRIFSKNLSIDSLFSHGSTIHLKHSQNYFTIQFASLSNVMSNRPSYYYKLEGADKDWIPATNQEAIYTYLPGGRYTFKVRCVSPDGVESQNITSFVIRIQPPLYLRPWFIVLSVIIIGSIIFYILSLRSKRRQERESIRNRIARDLHDDMGSTLSTINILSSMAKSKLQTDEVRVSEFINKISDNSQRMMEAMDDIVWAIKPDNDSMQKIIARMREFATHSLESKDIDLDFQVGENVNNIKLDMEQRKDLFLVFKEAVNNIAKYSKCDKTEIRVATLQQRLVLTIQDNGVGFDVTAADNGNGLGNMQKRADALNGRLQIQSKPGEGTQITLNIPVP